MTYRLEVDVTDYYSQTLSWWDDESGSVVATARIKYDKDTVSYTLESQLTEAYDD